MSTPIIVYMPYGEIEISTVEQAVSFIKHKCDACDRNSRYQPCSAYYSDKCMSEENKVVEYFRGVNNK